MKSKAAVVKAQERTLNQLAKVMPKDKASSAELGKAKEETRSALALVKAEPQDAEPAPSPPAPPVPPPAPTPAPSPGELLFDADFSKPLIAAAVEGVPAHITYADGVATFMVQPGEEWPLNGLGSERCEYVVNDGKEQLDFAEGTDLYIHNRLMALSTDTSVTPYRILNQLHEDSNSNSPGTALFLDPGHQFRIGAGDSSVTWWQSGAVTPDVFHDITYRVLLSQDTTKGIVQVWLDGELQKLADGSSLIHAKTATLAKTFMKFGIYRSKESTGITRVPFELFKVGTSLAAVS